MQASAPVVQHYVGSSWSTTIQSGIIGVQQCSLVYWEYNNEVWSSRNTTIQYGF